MGDGRGACSLGSSLQRESRDGLTVDAMFTTSSPVQGFVPSRHLKRKQNNERNELSS
jgi:hypothetical protein